MQSSQPAYISLKRFGGLSHAEAVNIAPIASSVRPPH
jgi:hypothetical protein